jgi:hypothetical protein
MSDPSTQDEAARLAGWNPEDGPAPNEHTLPPEDDPDLGNNGIPPTDAPLVSGTDLREVTR